MTYHTPKERQQVQQIVRFFMDEFLCQHSIPCVKEKIQKKKRQMPPTLVEKNEVCVTGGASLLSLAIAKLLSTRGYSIKIIIRNEDDKKKLKELQLGLKESIVSVTADPNSMESLIEAFEGCIGVFHTGEFIDPAGLSGYTHSMVGVEVKTTENVIKACAITGSVEKCVLTSSLVACIWSNISRTIDHNSWSDEPQCVTKKLWYALGKLKAERAAWSIAKENINKLQLATICPALIMGDGYFTTHPTPSLAYLKGGREMFRRGLLATVAVTNLAKAHIQAFHATTETSNGKRYICYDKLVESHQDAEKLATDIGLSSSTLCDYGTPTDDSVRCRIVPTALPLFARRFIPCYSQSYLF